MLFTNFAQIQPLYPHGNFTTAAENKHCVSYYTKIDSKSNDLCWKAIIF
jgi:hypothetical protein